MFINGRAADNRTIFQAADDLQMIDETAPSSIVKRTHNVHATGILGNFSDDPSGIARSQGKVSNLSHFGL